MGYTTVSGAPYIEDLQGLTCIRRIDDEKQAFRANPHHLSPLKIPEAQTFIATERNVAIIGSNNQAQNFREFASDETGDGLPDVWLLVPESPDVSDSYLARAQVGLFPQVAADQPNHDQLLINQWSHGILTCPSKMTLVSLSKASSAPEGLDLHTNDVVANSQFKSLTVTSFQYRVDVQGDTATVGLSGITGYHYNGTSGGLHGPSPLSLENIAASSGTEIYLNITHPSDDQKQE